MKRRVTSIHKGCGTSGILGSGSRVLTFDEPKIEINLQLKFLKIFFWSKLQFMPP
jgi:hypothetical protein